MFVTFHRDDDDPFKPTTPSKEVKRTQSKEKTMDPTPEKVPAVKGPVAAQGLCRPADFGKPKKRGPVVMARAGQPVVLNGAELDEEAQRTQQADEDLQLLPDEDADVDLVPGQIRRKSHKRLCKSLQPSEHTVKSKAVKGYLSSIGIAYPVFQRFHARRAVWDCGRAFCRGAVWDCGRACCRGAVWDSGRSFCRETCFFEFC